MSPHSNTLFWFQANQSLLFLLNAACLAEKQQIPILLSLAWLKPTIYCTRGEHANHYTTDADFIKRNKVFLFVLTDPNYCLTNIFKSDHYFSRICDNHWVISTNTFVLMLCFDDKSFKIFTIFTWKFFKLFLSNRFTSL